MHIISLWEGDKPIPPIPQHNYNTTIYNPDASARNLNILSDIYHRVAVGDEGEIGMGEKGEFVLHMAPSHEFKSLYAPVMDNVEEVWLVFKAEPPEKVS